MSSKRLEIRIANEEDPLLVKNYDENLSISSGGTADTTSSDEAGMFDSIKDVVAESVDQLVEGAKEITTDIVEGAKEATNDLIGNVQEKAGDMQEAVEEVTADVKEAVIDEYHEVKDALLDELHEANDGDKFFLDMALTRNLSILPGELAEVAKVVNKEHGAVPTTDVKVDVEALPIVEKPAPEIVTTSAPFSAYVGLASAVISLSSIGPLLALEDEVSGTMKIFWRMAGTAMILFPFALVDIIRNGFPKLTSAQWITFLLSTVSYITMGIGFVLALSYTAVGNAVILANSQAIMLLLGNLSVGAPVTFLEGSGAMIAFGGAILCSKDSSEAGTDAVGGMTLFGDLLAIIAGLGGVGYLVFAKTSRTNMNIFVFTFLTMAVGCGMTVPFQMFILRETVTFGMDRSTGLWGFLNIDPNRLPLEVTMVLVCNICGTMGYVRAMQYFDSLVISVAGLMEPVVAEFMAFLLGVGFLPGWKGWLGNALVAAGTCAVVYPIDNKKSVAAAH